MENNQQFIERLREDLLKFFKMYDEYGAVSTTHEKVKVLEDITCLFYRVANELWNRTAPPEDQAFAKNIAEQILPPIDLENGRGRVINNEAALFYSSTIRPGIPHNPKFIEKLKVEYTPESDCDILFHQLLRIAADTYRYLPGGWDIYHNINYCISNIVDACDYFGYVLEINGSEDQYYRKTWQIKILDQEDETKWSMDFGPDYSEKINIEPKDIIDIYYDVREERMVKFQ